MDVVRTFIALDLPAAVRDQAGRLQQIMMRRCAGVRWVKPEQMHLTLKFLGETKADKIRTILTMLDRMTWGIAPFVLDIGGIGAFPNPRNPKVIWAGIGVEARLVDFQQRIDTELEQLGFPKEKREFSPHLTLGRVKDGTYRKELVGCIEQHSTEHIGIVEVSQVVFFRSELTPSGPIYSVLGEFSLHGQH